MLAKIFLSPLVDDRTLCYGLSQRVDSLNETLYRDEALTENYEKDSKLCDMHDILVSENDGIDKPRCSGICNGCLVKIQDIIKGVTVGFVLGTDRDMRVCFQCFQQREFNFSEECTTHNNRAE